MTATLKSYPLSVVLCLLSVLYVALDLMSRHEFSLCRILASWLRVDPPNTTWEYCSAEHPGRGAPSCSMIIPVVVNSHESSDDSCTAKFRWSNRISGVPRGAYSPCSDQWSIENMHETSDYSSEINSDEARGARLYQTSMFGLRFRATYWANRMW